MGIFDASKAVVRFVPFVVLFNTLVHIPIATVIARPGGVVSYLLRPLLNAFTVNDYQRVVVITLIYYFMTYTGSAALSITGATMGNPEGYLNEEPRHGRDRLTGLPHRLHAIHLNLIETFPSFATCVAITLALPLYIADSTEPMEQCINFLLLAAFCKAILYVPAYAFGYATIRSLIHLMNNGALLGLIISVIKSANVAQDQDTFIDILN